MVVPPVNCAVIINASPVSVAWIVIVMREIVISFSAETRTIVVVAVVK